jgi:phosphatidylglycerol:prolipoprotein diacylglycerol transferase
MMSTYTVLLDAGLLIALVLVGQRARRRVARPQRWLDAAVVALVSGVVGGRLGYVLGHQAYFVQHPEEILQFWEGGLAWHGALVGTIVGLSLATQALALRFWRLADEIALVAPLVGAAGGLGCLAVGCAYGRPGAGPDWLLADLPDLYGVWALRPNVQLASALWSLALAMPLSAVRRWWRPGTTTGLFLALYGGGLAVLSPLRGDPVRVVAGWRLDTWLNGLVGVAGLVILGFGLIGRERR